uniref:hypothetical protein n=1 Tax=uncultured Bilophila sp. TaxID=529385 RepID=UPI0025CFCF78|nr:hypothetical protein [uncultured Bilophila sp.]
MKRSSVRASGPVASRRRPLRAAKTRGPDGHRISLIKKTVEHRHVVLECEKKLLKNPDFLVWWPGSLVNQSKHAPGASAPSRIP